MRSGLVLLLALSAVAVTCPVEARCDPITYELVADVGETWGSTLAGVITWDSTVGSPTLSNASTLAIDFRFQDLASTVIWAWDKSDPKFEDSRIKTDETSFIGTFGVTDLVPATDHNWLLYRWPAQDLWLSLSNGANLQFWLVTLVSGGHFGIDRAVSSWDEPSPWTLRLVSPPVPEPTSLALFGLGAAGLAVYRRRKARKA